MTQTTTTKRNKRKHKTKGRQRVHIGAYCPVTLQRQQHAYGVELKKLKQIDSERRAHLGWQGY